MNPQLNATTVASPHDFEKNGEDVGLNSPGVWVAASMLVVIAIMLWKGVPGLIAFAVAMIILYAR